MIEIETEKDTIYNTFSPGDTTGFYVGSVEESARLNTIFNVCITVQYKILQIQSVHWNSHYATITNLLTTGTADDSCKHCWHLHWKSIADCSDPYNGDSDWHYLVGNWEVQADNLWLIRSSVEADSDWQQLSLPHCQPLQSSSSLSISLTTSEETEGEELLLH